MADFAQPPLAASRNALELWINNAAEEDPAVRQALLQNAGPALECLFGRKLPPAITLTAVAEAPGALYLVRRFEGATEPLEPTGSPAQLLRTAVHAIAMREPGFWDTLAANPQAVLAERLALRVPAETQIQVLDEDAETAYLVLHHPPHLRGWQPPLPVLQRLPVMP